MRSLRRQTVLRGVRAGQTIDGPQTGCDTAIVPGTLPEEQVQVTTVDVRPGQSDGQLVMDVEVRNDSSQTLEATVSVDLGGRTDAFTFTLEPGQSDSFAFDEWEPFEAGADVEGCAVVTATEVV